MMSFSEWYSEYKHHYDHDDATVMLADWDDYVLVATHHPHLVVIGPDVSRRVSTDSEGSR